MDFRHRERLQEWPLAGVKTVRWARARNESSLLARAAPSATSRGTAETREHPTSIAVAV